MPKADDELCVFTIHESLQSDIGTLLTLKGFCSVLPISHGIIRLLYFQVLHMMNSALHARSAKQCQRSVEQGIWWCS